MMLPLLLLSFLFQTVLGTYYCNKTADCPASFPCCSHSGVCGTGTYCLGGCDPRYSHNLTACVSQPVCRSGEYKFSKDILVPVGEFLGDAEEYQWTYDGYIVEDEDDDDSLLLAMPANSSGTLISSTFFVWYGKVTTRFKSAHYAGVISASILFSNVQDEIDTEFIGNALEEPQSNFYYQGVLNYTNEVNMTANDTHANWHTYEVDWQEDHITWSIDGTEMRTLEKDDTYNSTYDTYMFPQTPSRIQLSLWAGGDSENAPGVIAWAGGDINWDEPDFSDPGYVYAKLDTITVDCYDPPEDTSTYGNLSYAYKSSKSFEQGDIMITNNETVLDDLGETGWDIGKNDTSSSSVSKSVSSKKTTKLKTYTTKGSTYTTSEVTTEATTIEVNTALPDGYSSEFFQDISSSTSTNGAAVLCASFLGSVLLMLSYLL